MRLRRCQSDARLHCIAQGRAQGDLREPLLESSGSQEQESGPHQLQARVQREAAFNEALILERDQGIAEIQHSIAEINEIFRDLAVLVHEQGEQIDDIEANILRSEQRTREAGEQIAKAEKGQKAARNRLLIILVLFAVLVLVLALVLFT